MVLLCPVMCYQMNKSIYEYDIKYVLYIPTVGYDFCCEGITYPASKMHVLSPLFIPIMMLNMVKY